MAVAPILSSIRAGARCPQFSLPESRSRQALASSMEVIAAPLHAECHSLHSSQKLGTPFGGHVAPHKRASVRCQVALENGESSSSQGSNVLSAGTRVVVTEDLKVYHIPKAPELNLNGLEGEIVQVSLEWKGVPISATLPYKIKFETLFGGAKLKFFAHLKDDEFKVL